ncbi:MAG: UDP-N-acetylmuramate dehydrogenase, partial [Cyclobacteriaceae bacterium]
NTFGIDVQAKYLCRIKSVEEFPNILASPLFKSQPSYILGAGSNILFTENFDGLIIRVELKGIEILDEDQESVSVRVFAGENWHQFVLHALSREWGGIENLSLIPGTVGAAPMQNIGAYGVEIKNLIEKVEAIEISTGRVREFNNEECRFGYRESVFKKDLMKKYFISSVTLRLSKNNHHLNTTYGAIQDTLSDMRVDEPTIQSISDAVIQIRKSKLPDPVIIGNAGSFFKNPTIPIEQHKKLQTKYFSIPGYVVDNQNIKVPAGWLIEQCEWKGKRVNNVGVHPNQALVLVNYGGGKGKEILELSKKISESVAHKFEIELIPEVNIL